MNSNSVKLYFEVTDNDLNISYKIRINDDEKKFDEQYFNDRIFADSVSIPNITFLPFMGISHYKLINLFGAIQINDLESFVNNTINNIDDRITEFKKIFANV